MQAPQIEANQIRIESRKIKDFSTAKDWPCSDVLKRVFLGRNVHSLRHLDFPLSNLLTPETFKNASHSTEVLCDAIKSNQSILIIGDYDTDGATATTLGLLGLSKLGASFIDYLVPNRFEYGYGLSVGIAEVAISMAPDLVITVDNGINSVDGVALLKSAGIRVLITDHHLPSGNLPAADSILNPNQPGCGFPSKNLSGVGVMFYLLLMVRAELKDQGWFELKSIPVPNLAEYLDLVALGTVADVVPLDYNNRILVSQGISRMKMGKCRPGIVALMEVAGKHFNSLVSSDLGFVVAPRLNAAGRLEDISMGIECLLSGDGGLAKELALQLNEINQERKLIEKEMQIQATDIVEKLIRSYSENSGYCLYDSSWHQGITGLVASRVKEKTRQPVIAFAPTMEGLLTGSARSVDGLHIKDLLERLATQNPELIAKFGGHAMAAGLTIDPGKLNQFKSLFALEVNQYFSKNEPEHVLLTDGRLADEEIQLITAEEINHAAPWGQGFPVPSFDGQFLVEDSKLLKGEHLKLKLLSSQSARLFDAIAFRFVENGLEAPEMKEVRIVYQLDINDFRGRKSLQLIVQHLEILR